VRNVRCLLAALLLLLPAGAGAQVLRGTVIEDPTGAPIAGAIIDILHRGEVLATARSDSTGAFLLLPRRSGTFTIRAAHAFHTAVDSLPLTIDPGGTLTIVLRLARAAIPLEPLVVTARTESRLAGFQERMRLGTGFGQFVTRAEIDARPAARTTDLLRELPGVEVTTVGRGGSDQPTAIGTPDVTIARTSVITLRTSRGPCMPALYVDGLSIRQFEDSSIDDLLRPDMIEGVEVYPRSAGAPPEFIDPTMCGVVAFWTRPGPEEGRWSWARAAAGAAAFVLMVALTR
jgi:hypothetical protein